MSRPPLLLSVLLICGLCTCGVQRAPGPSSRQDAGEVRRDASGVDAQGNDSSGFDTARPDTARADSARPDTARPDSAAPCEDDSYEPNNSDGAAAGLPGAGTYPGLISCNDDWYSFALPLGSGARVSIQFSDNAGDLDLYIYDAVDPGASLDSSVSTTDDEQVVVAPSSSQRTMLVRVHSYDGLQTSYDMQVDFTQSQPNDLCQGAELVTVPSDGRTVNINGDTTGVADSRNSSLSSCQALISGYDAPELFYSFTTTPSMDGFVTASLQTDGWLGVVYAFANSCQASVDIDCAEESSTFRVVPNTTYFVAVDAYDYEAGSFDLVLGYAAPPDNNSCGGAQVLAVPTDGSALTVSESTSAATHTRSASDSSSSCQAVARFAPDLFYRIDTGPGGGGSLLMTLESPGWDSALYMFPASCGASTELFCTSEGTRADPLWMRQDVQASSSYYLVVDGYGDACCDPAAGPFTLELSYHQPAPDLQGGDLCETAVQLSGSSGGARGSTAYGNDLLAPSDVGCGSPASGNEKFYRLSLGAGQRVDLRLVHGDPDKEAVLYIMRDGCPPASNACIDVVYFADAPEASLSHQNNTGASADYLVVVDARYSSGGESYDLFWQIY